MPEDVVAGGHIQPFGKETHLQGGCFIGKTSWFKKHPYDEKHFPFSFMDVYISRKIRGDGKKYANIEGVVSIMGEYKRLRKYKIIHAHKVK